MQYRRLKNMKRVVLCYRVGGIDNNRPAADGNDYVGKTG